jgi:Protein of unknown function (DUF1189)
MTAPAPHVESPNPESPATPGELSTFSWLAAGFVMPCFNLNFYRRGVRRGSGLAIGFFMLFALGVTLVQTLRVGAALVSAGQDLQRAYLEGRVPTLTIQSGVATSDPARPFIISDESGMLIAIDTTGAIRNINRTRYAQGMLLTRSTIQILNQGAYRTLPIIQVQQLLQRDPIILDAPGVARLWQRLTLWVTGIVLGVMLLANLLVWFIAIAILTGLVRVLVGLLGWRGGYGEAISVGLYAAVPAVYIAYLLGLLGVRFMGVQALIQIVVMLIVFLSGAGEAAQPSPAAWAPLHAWRSLIGLPFLAALVLDAASPWPYRAIVMWTLTLVTVLAYVLVTFIPGEKAAAPPPPEAPAGPSRP